MQKQTILVTGGAGFVGSNLCRRLAADGHSVISLDNYFTGSRDTHVPGVEYREGNTLDIEKLVPETPDIIYHLGEYSRTEESFNDIPLVWEYNVLGTYAVLEYWRKRNVKLVYTGSSTKFSDGGAGRDQSPYAWTKASNTDLVKNYGAWFDLPYAITYFYNVYGPGELSNKYGTVVAIFARLRAEGKPLPVRSPGTQRRHFTHVDDIVEGLILIGAKGLGDEYGLGSDESFSVQEVAEMFGSPIEMVPNRPGNRMDTEVDYSKASKEFGWKAKYRLGDYIASLPKI